MRGKDCEDCQGILDNRGILQPSFKSCASTNSATPAKTNVEGRLLNADCLEQYCETKLRKFGREGKLTYEAKQAPNAARLLRIADMQLPIASLSYKPACIGVHEKGPIRGPSSLLPSSFSPFDSSQRKSPELAQGALLPSAF
jgi:hypothetical protein